MAKLRVFISSTYYDLRWIRRSVEQFIETMGYEATVFESGDVPFSHTIPLDESCFREIGLCHMLVLVIGGRYGSPASDNKIPESSDQIDQLYAYYNSVTKKEYEVARSQDIPIYIFVEKGVLAEYETYKKNRDSKIAYAHVDSINVFRLLDDIFLQSRNNLVREFSNADDITSWLREQWAGLFAHFVTQRREQMTVGQIRSEIESLTAVADALKSYSEQLVRTISKKDSEEIITRVEGELQTKRIESAFRRISEFEHAIDAHNLDLSMAQHALRESRSREEFIANLGTFYKGCHQLRLYLQDSDNVHELNRLRRELRLRPWDTSGLDSNLENSNVVVGS